MMRSLILIATLILLAQCTTQEIATVPQTVTNMAKKIVKTPPTADIPYHQIPDYPSSYEAGNVAGRTVDGLGYRYYWATKDLRAEDLAYQPSPEAASLDKTLDHLFGLSLTIKNATLGKPNIRPMDPITHNPEERRAATLRNFKIASDNLKASTQKDLEGYSMVFQRGDKQSEFPFWNLLNGPIADAIYHTGQVVSFRRTSKNPIHTGVNVLMGKTKE